MTLGLGIVGGGGAAGLVGAALAETRSVRLAACTSAQRERAEAFAARYGAGRVHDDLAGLLGDDDVEAVYLATPNALHAAQALAAIEAGRHVLVEKPLTIAADDADAVTTAAAGAGVVLGVGFHLRHAEPLRELQRRVAAGDVGAPRLLRATWGMVLPQLQGWKDDPALAGGGALMGLGVHALDLALWLVASEPVQVGAVVDAGSGRLDRAGVFTVGFDGGCLAEVAVSRATDLGSNSLAVYGSEGALVAEDALTVRPEGRLLDTGGRVLAEATRDPYAAELDAFAAAVGGGEPFRADGRDGAAVVRLTERLLAAAR